jgi:hypothetical protein
MKPLFDKFRKVTKTTYEDFAKMYGCCRQNIEVTVSKTKNMRFESKYRSIMLERIDAVIEHERLKFAKRLGELSELREEVAGK